MQCGFSKGAVGIADVMQCVQARDEQLGVAKRNRMVWRPLGHNVNKAGMMITVATTMLVY